MHFLKVALAGCLFVISGALNAQTDDVPDVDPTAVEIIAQASAFLASHPELSVQWFVSHDTVVDGREKLTETRSGYNLLSRENGLYAYLERGMATREFFFDGATFTVFDVENNAYAQVNFAGGFEELVDRVRSEYNLQLPIWSVLSTRYEGQFLEAAEQAAYLGLTRVGGEVAHHIALSNYDEDWQVWIADDPESPRLLMLVGTNPYEQGWPQYRAYFTNWDFAPEMEEGVFKFIPNEDSERMSWPKVPAE